MLDKLLRLTRPKLLLIGAAWVSSVVMHNVVYALVRDSLGPRGDEPFFLLLAVVVIPLYFAASLIYTIVQRIRRPF
jgi:hypothetical protein